MKARSKEGIIIEGKRIYLRRLREEDVDGPYAKWMKDPEVTQYLESRFSKNSRASILKFVRGMLASKDVLFLAIILKDGNRHIGNIKLGPINTAHSSAEIGIMIGEKDCWGKGYGSEAITLLKDYAFNELKIHKITAGCYSNNRGSAKAFEKAGFKLEGVRKSQYRHGKGYVDGMLFGALNKK